MVSFAGLFDTVSSYGVIKSNDVSELNLNAVSKARSAIHLTAMDECRANFPLININSKGAVFEKAIPGDHADVGGGYLDNMTEVKSRLCVGMGSTLNEEKERLISEGWYTMERQLKASGRMGILSGERKSLSNNYSFLPLYLMCESAMKKPVYMKILFDDLKDKFKIPSSLAYAKKRVYEYVFDGGRQFKFYTREQLESEIKKVKTTGFAKVMEEMEARQKPQEISTFVKTRYFTTTPDVEAVPIELNPDDYNEYPDLKQKIEDHYALKNIRHNYLHLSHNYLDIVDYPNKGRSRTVYNG